MIYASSKDRFKRELDGIQVELQATDRTEMDLDVFNSRAHWIVQASYEDAFFSFLTWKSKWRY